MSETSLVKKPATLRTQLESNSFKEQVAKVLPNHLKPERFIRVAVTAMTRTPELANCDQRSFFKALIDLSSYGLEPDGRRAHLIPFNNRRAGIVECQLIIDYKGLAELALRSGIISTIHADVVCENDDFDYDMGEVKWHKVDLRKDRGEPYAAYAIAKTKDGGMFCQVMGKAEIEGIRNNSQGYKVAEKYGKDSPWTGQGKFEMWKKTAFRRLAKWLPLSAEFRDAVASEDETDGQSFANRAEQATTVVEAFELPENPLAKKPVSTEESQPEVESHPATSEELFGVKGGEE